MQEPPVQFSLFLAVLEFELVRLGHQAHYIDPGASARMVTASQSFSVAWSVASATSVRTPETASATPRPGQCLLQRTIDIWRIEDGPFVDQLASAREWFHHTSMRIETANLLYLLPFLPTLGRLAIVARFTPLQNDILSEQEHDRESYRTHILGLAGLSFIGVSAFAVVETTLKTGLSWAINYFLLSFFAYMFSLNVVYVKGRRWEDQLATALSEMGTWSLFLALIATLRATLSNAAALLAGIATFIWVLDHWRRIGLDWNHHSKLLKAKGIIV